MNLYFVFILALQIINGFNTVDGLYKMVEQKIIMKLEKLRQQIINRGASIYNKFGLMIKSYGQIMEIFKQNSNK